MKDDLQFPDIIRMSLVKKIMEVARDAKIRFARETGLNSALIDGVIDQMAIDICKAFRVWNEEITREMPARELADPSAN